MNESTVRRLAFAKYLYQVGVVQSSAPELMAAASVLTFHDAAEFFLQIASEHLNSGASHPNFLEYWQILGKKLHREVAHKEGMRRLNKARVALKHSGTLPSRLDVESFRTTITLFLEENTRLIFGVPFADISLLAFVEPSSARGRLEEAERLLQAGELESACDQAAVAFEIILDDYIGRKELVGRSPFAFGESLSFSSFDLQALRANDGGAARVVEKLVKSVEEMQQAMRVVALGIDYRRYARFKMFAPIVIPTIDGTYHISRWAHEGAQLIGNAETRFVIDFVIEAALRILDFDFDVYDPWRERAPA